MRKYRTHEEFIDDMFKVHPNIEILSEFENTSTKIHARCKIDGYEWNAKAGALLRGRNCPRCSGKERKTTDRFRYEVSLIDDSIDVVGEYINIATKISCECKVCGYIFSKWPRDLLSGSGCPHCHKREQYTTESFKKKVSTINKNVTVIGEYTGANNHIKCKCNKCGLIWDITASHLISGHGCPHCKSSAGENKISEYLERNNIEYIQEKRFSDCRYKYTLPFDFYIESKNILIEYDGIQHFKPIQFNGSNYDHIKAFNEQQIKDKIKTQYCIDNGIKLIRIAYTELDDIESILDKQIQ